MISDVLKKYRIQFIIAGIFVLSLVVYIYTLCPSLGWEDAPKFPKEAYLLKVSALPWSHPLYIIIGNLFTKIPVGDVAYRMNLVSAVFGSLALVVTFLLLRLLFSLENGVSENKKLLAALGAILSLMVSRTFWFHSVTSEIYIVLSFFTMAVIYCLVRFHIKEETRFLYLGLFLYGLSVSVHIMTACLLPAFIIYLIMMGIKYKDIQYLKRIGTAALCFLAGFSLYLGFAVKDFLFFKNTYHTPLSTFVDIMTGGGEKGYFLHANYPLWYSPLQAIGYHFYDFMVLGTLLGAFGLFMFLTKNMRRFGYIFAAYAVYFGYATIFYPADQNTFFLPALTLFSIFIGYGLLRSLKLATSKLKTNLVTAVLLSLLVVAPVTVYHTLPTYIAGLDREERNKWEGWLVEEFNRAYGRRGEWELKAVWQQQEGKELLFKHYLNPNQRDDLTPREYADSLLDDLPPNSVFITGSVYDWYAMSLIDYLKMVENKRPDVEHIHWEFPEEFFTNEALIEAMAANVGERPVFVSAVFRYLWRAMERWTGPLGYEFIPKGLIYEVKRE